MGRTAGIRPVNSACETVKHEASTCLYSLRAADILSVWHPHFTGACVKKFSQ